MRLFIAVELTEEIKDRIEEQINRLKRMGGNIRWVKRDALHITLKFLGEVSPARVKAIERAMDRAASKVNSFPLKLRGCGRFPLASSRPRVLWVGVEDPGEISRLQEILEDELLREGFQKETRAFHPHVTVGRVKGTSALRKVVGEIDELRDEVFGRVEVKRIVLFRSRLTPDGPIYTELYAAELR